MSKVIASPAVLERFWAKVDKSPTDGCWVWVAARTAGGYGRFKAPDRYWMAHRFAYAVMVDEVPRDLDLDHLCRNRACVNPAHLEPVTHRENILRGTNFAAQKFAAAKCQRGHAYEGDNLVLLPTKYGTTTRRCRACLRESCRQADRRYKAKRKAERQG